MKNIAQEWPNAYLFQGLTPAIISLYPSQGKKNELRHEIEAVKKGTSKIS